MQNPKNSEIKTPKSPYNLQSKSPNANSPTFQLNAQKSSNNFTQTLTQSHISDSISKYPSKWATEPPTTLASAQTTTNNSPKTVEKQVRFGELPGGNNTITATTTTNITGANDGQKSPKKLYSAVQNTNGVANGIATNSTTNNTNLESKSPKTPTTPNKNTAITINKSPKIWNIGNLKSSEATTISLPAEIIKSPYNIHKSPISHSSDEQIPTGDISGGISGDVSGGISNDGQIGGATDKTILTQEEFGKLTRDYIYVSPKYYPYIRKGDHIRYIMRDAKSKSETPIYKKGGYFLDFVESKGHTYIKLSWMSPNAKFMAKNSMYLIRLDNIVKIYKCITDYVLFKEQDEKINKLQESLSAIETNYQRVLVILEDLVRKSKN